MNNVSQIQSVEQTRADEASNWVARLDKGLSVEEEKALNAWLSLSPENHREFMETAKFWDRMDGLSRLADIFPEPVLEEKPGLLVTQGWKVAASVILAVGLISFWFGQVSPVEEGVDIASIEASGRYETSIGEQSVFHLEDGTRMVLNTNSVVTVDYTDKNRLLKLERGEIHVTVAHDPSRPLSVMVGDRIVQAVGTEFNVEITSDQKIELMVTEGVVIVGVLEESTDKSPIEDKPILISNGSTLVAAGQGVVINVTEDLVSATDIEPEAIAVKLSWREGNLIFRGESLEEAIAEVGRYTPVEFVFLDEESKKVRLVGLFRAGDVDGLLFALRENFNIAYEWQGEDKILLNGL